MIAPRRLAIAGAALVAALALIAAYGTLRGTDAEQRPPTRELSPTGAYGRELGPTGDAWRWLRRGGTIRIAGEGRRWFAFRAVSLRRDRTLTFAQAGGVEHAARITRRPLLQLVGPFDVHGASAIQLTTAPGPRRASRGDARRLSVFLSPLHVLETPLYAEPSTGFYAPERARTGSYRWMRGDGRIELIADPSVVPRAWISFSASSHELPRALEVRGTRAGDAIRHDVPPSATRKLVFGPYPVGTRRTSLGLTARPGARRLGARDARRASVRLYDVKATDRRPSGDALSAPAAVALLCALEALLAFVAWLVAGRRLAPAALGLIAATAPLEIYRTPLAGTNVSLFRLSLALGLVVVLSGGWRTPLEALRNRLVLSYLALALVTVLSTVAIASDRAFGLRLLAIMAVGIAAIVIVAALVRRTSLRCACRAFAAGALLPLLAASWQSIAPLLGLDPTLPCVDLLPAATGLEVTRLDTVSLSDSVIRLKGTFGDPNHFGAYLVVCVPIALAVSLDAAIERRRDEAVVAAGIAMAASIMVVATYSRSALLGAVAGTAVLVALLVPTLRPLLPALPRRWRWRWLALAAVAVVLVVCAPLAPTLADRLDPSADVNTVTNAGHSSTADAALELFGDHPLLGAGPGELGRELGQGKRTSGAHSSYLTIAAELGLLGLLALAAAIALTLAALIRSVREAFPQPRVVIGAGLLAAYVSFVIASAFYDLWWDDFHWLLLGVIVGGVAMARPAPQRTGSPGW